MFHRSALLALSLTLTPCMASAADGGWMTERFNIVVRDQDIRDVLRQFGTLAGVPVVLSDGVDALITARFESATGTQVIEAMASEYGLDWRYDGRRIEVSSNSEHVSRILDMGGVKQQDLVEALEALDSYESRFPIAAADGELGMIVGPPRYVAIVEIVLAQMVEARESQQAEQRRREEAERLARAESERRRLAEEERLRLLRERAAAQRQSGPTGPLVNRGGRWGG